MSKKTPIKILYLITKSNWGGAQKYIYDLALEAKKRGYVVSVACGGTGEAGAAAGRLVEELNTTEIKTHPVLNFMRNMSPLRDLKALVEVWRLLRKEKPDVLHLSSSKAGGIGALAGRLAGIKRIIFTSHGLTIDETWRPRWQRTLIYLGTWLTLRLSHHTIMINTETYKRASNMPGIRNRVSLVKNGIAPIMFLERQAARASLALPAAPSTIIIGGIGELHPNKNWTAAILALKTLPKHVHLVIIGEGEEYQKLTNLITQEQLQDRVHLTKANPAAQLLPAFDIFILPSIKEGLPYVLLEAGLAELSVVASDLPGNRDIITSGETGLLVEPTPTHFATSLQILIRDEKMRRQHAAALHQVITEQFSIENMFEQTQTLYDSNSSFGR